MGASVVTRVDAPPVLEPAEHVLDLVALAIEPAVVFDRYFSIGLGGDAGGDFALCESLAEPAGVVALVGEEFPRPGQDRQHQCHALVVAHLPLAEQHDEGASLGAPDTSGNRPFFKRLAAVRCALRCVASIMIRPGLPPLRASSAKILLNTPRRLQRINRL